jgi:probable F420-dependent oxidoreductase
LKIDVMLTAGWPSEAPARAEALHHAGVDGIFTFENAHDVFLPLVTAATARPDLDVDYMTNVAIAFPRSPLHVAYAANDLQHLTSGRFRLGLGTQVKAHNEKRYGATWSRPAARIGELVRAIRAIFDAWERTTERLDFRGEFTTHTLMTPAFDPGPNPFGPPPILVGALGPKMCEMAGAVADGVLVMPFNSERHFHERTLPALARRNGDGFEIVPEVIVAMGRTADEQQAAANGVKGLLSFYASTPSYRPVLDVEGRGELQPELNALSKQGRWADMAQRIDDDLLHTLAVAGTPEDCAVQIATRFGDHADLVCCYFPGYPVTDERIGELVTALHAAT